MFTNRFTDMMKFFIMVSAILMVTNAQRPSYASSGPIGRPGLASRFKDDNATSSSTVSVENRIGEDGSTPKIPVDARGDVDLVNTLNTWEREHQPFWLLNADHIEKARNTTRGTQQTSNRNQFNSQNGQAIQTNSQGTQGNRPDGSSNVQTNLSNRGGSLDNINNTDNGNQRNQGTNRNWLYGRPSPGDIKPIYETPERNPSDRNVRIHQQNEGSQKKLRFHYERNSFP